MRLALLKAPHNVPANASDSLLDERQDEILQQPDQSFTHVVEVNLDQPLCLLAFTGTMASTKASCSGLERSIRLRYARDATAH